MTVLQPVGRDLNSEAALSPDSGIVSSLHSFFHHASRLPFVVLDLHAMLN